ncbi:hypothetical protein LAZ67_8003069 [Cordylochernes scorpioides]|uniref:Uncharacterized protein n=1 Tax=Cordylochernes scorpioides TaxID=51811 RepID=A0ABY6KWE3_9ARAC|nr:hypothetical protein LAZ67_8003069 [Cordylochernes scorpioides]
MEEACAVADGRESRSIRCEAPPREDFAVNKVVYPPSVILQHRDHRGVLSPMAAGTLKSVLKKKSAVRSIVSHKRRVTFDEAVSFYCDDYPDIRFLALRSDVSSDLYFMFEPPPEYQDWNPDPPAEYRDRCLWGPGGEFVPPPPPPSCCWGTLPDKPPPPPVIPEPEPKVSQPETPTVLPEERYLPDLVEECSTSFNDYSEIEEGLLDELRKGNVSEDVTLDLENSDHFPKFNSDQLITAPPQLYSVDSIKMTIMEENGNEKRTNLENSEADVTKKDSSGDAKILQKQESEQSESSEIDLELEIIAKEEEERANIERETMEKALDNLEKPPAEEETEDGPDLSETSSQIRKYFEENALTCSILRGIEARRRDEKKFARPKSPLPSRDSLVEQLRRLTALDDDDGNITGDDDEPTEPVTDISVPRNFPEPAVPMPQNGYQEVHVTQVTHIQQSFNPYMPAPPPPPANFPPAMYPIHGAIQPQYIEEERVTTHLKNDTLTTTVNKTFKTNRFKAHFEQTLRRHLADGDEARRTTLKVEGGGDELERFVQQDLERIQRLKKRYSVAEEDEDPTFGFARRPSVRGIRTRFGSTTEILKQLHTQMSRGAGANHPSWPRYAPTPHEYYSSTLWAPRDRRSLQEPHPAPPIMPPPPSKDERGTPEGASSSPQVSSDSLYTAPPIEMDRPSKESGGVIYYSMNV